MVLRKPYAFLIKNFKIIHLFVFILSIIIFYSYNRIFSFFNEYIKTGQVIFNEDLVTLLIKPYVFLCLVFVVGISIIILILMKQKEKPNKLYIAIIATYTILFFMFLVNANYISIIQYEGLEPRSVRILRDINFIFVIIQFMLCIFILVRAIGFDIKKFNFGQDLVELKIEETDSEEFELQTTLDVDKAELKYRRQIRELKYFYLENKKVINGLGVLLLVVTLVFILFRVNFSNKVYSEKQVLNFNNLKFSVLKSYRTNLNYRGINITDDKNTYIVLLIEVENDSNEDKKLLSSNLLLDTKKSTYAAETTKHSSFIDIGVGYKDQTIKSKQKAKFILTYKIKETEKNDKMIFRYSDYVAFYRGVLHHNYKNVRINPVYIDEKVEIETSKTEVEVYYGLSFLKETTLKINQIYYANEHYYYEDEVYKVISEPLKNKIVMKIEYDFKKDKTVNYISNFFDFIEKHGKIIYKIEGKYKEMKYENLTPKGFKEQSIFLSVDEQILYSNEIILVSNIRNKIYYQKLK